MKNTPLWRWCVTNSIWMIILIAALGFGSTAAMNIVTFLIWLYFLMVLICIIGEVKIPNVEGLNKYLDLAYDFTVTLWLVGAGHWVLGTVYLVTMVFMQPLLHPTPENSISG